MQSTLTPEAILSTLRSLIAFKTTDDNRPEMFRCIEWIHSQFPGGFHIERFESGGIPSILIANRPGRSFDLILTGHLDVARRPVTTYEAVIRDDRVYGDGAFDMKGICAVMLEWMRCFGAAHPSAIALIFTMDEEAGGTDGSKYLLEHVGIRARAVVIPDGGYPEQITYGEKGWFPVLCTAVGKPARGSAPWRGVNALDVLIEQYMHLQSVFPSGLSDENNWHPTCTLIDLEICDKDDLDDALIQKATCILDISYTQPGEDEVLIEAMRRAAPLLTIDRSDLYTPVELVLIDPGHPVIECFNASVEAVEGQRWPLKRENGSSDARFYLPHGVPPLIFQANGAEAHLAGEWVSMESLLRCGRILNEFCDRWAKV